jgi:hypothetical protein
VGSEEPENLQRREAVLGSGSQVKFGQETKEELLSEMSRGSSSFGIFGQLWFIGLRVCLGECVSGHFCDSSPT